MNPESLLAALIAGALGGGGAGWLLKVWVQSRFETTVQQRVAEFRSRLDAVAAAIGYEHQRQLQTHALFITRKAEVVAELYHRVLDAQSQINRLIRGERDIPDIASMTREDAETYMIEHAGVPKGLASHIGAKWDDREAAVGEFERFLDTMRPEHARRVWVLANNYRLRHELFLSEATAAFASELTAALRRTLDIWQLQGGMNRSIEESLRDIASAMAHFRSLMQTELVTPGLLRTDKVPNEVGAV